MSEPISSPEKTDPRSGPAAPRPAEKSDKHVAAGTPATTSQPAAKTASGPPVQPDGWRETIESVVVAFVLAFLFRTFEAEAFVIPTGSMAPTLYGQHRDVYCEKCGVRFAAGVASLPSPEAEVRVDKHGASYLSSEHRSNFAVCPNANCRFPNDLLTREIFAGDRILVNKFPYEFSEPERWDVVVFKYPEGAKTNYIKRLVGLPGEEVWLEGGDVKVRPVGTQDEFRIARKVPDKQRELQLLVHDNDYPARELLAAGWPEAWANVDGAQWATDAEARAFRCDPDKLNPDVWHWLRYSNYSPTAGDWTRVLRQQPPSSQPRKTPVRDVYGYNSGVTVRNAESAVSRGELPDLVRSMSSEPEWVGDLTLTCTVEITTAEGELIFELVEGARAYQCRIDLKTGRGTLFYRHEQSQSDDEFEPAGEAFDTGLRAGRQHSFSFANVDDRLCVWIDDDLVKSLEFELGSRYAPPAAPVLETEADKTPIGIAARQASVRVSHLRIERDIFYINESPSSHMMRDTAYVLKDDEDDLEDEFLMLGDNNPMSNDSRKWLYHGVSRRLLIGKAFFIYWPHAVPFLNGGNGFPVLKYHEKDDPAGRQKPSIPRFSLPFYPQVGRMQRIH